MLKKKSANKQRYKITVSSRTDARKRPVVFSMARSVLIIALCALPLVVFATVGAAVITCSDAAVTSDKVSALQKEADIQIALIDMYSAEFGALRAALAQHSADGKAYGDSETQASLIAMETQRRAEPVALTENPAAAGPSALELYLASNGFSGAQATSSVVPLIPMTEAIDLINTDFESRINAQIETIKASESYDEFQIVYDGDFDGDSYAVSNWADVLSIYAAKTIYNGQKFLTITPDNIGVLIETYNDMNEVSIETEKILREAVYLNGEQLKETSMLVINVSVNSLTYCEEEKKHKFNRKQKKALENLMSPSYYTYFADLLGIDVYDGMRSDELENIIANLTEGTKGEAIVKSALIRLGHPYSRGRRGTGNYVDCSYFTWWVYNQAGIKLPTSSVEQAKYCYNKGCTVKLHDLKPGDIVFWRKTNCNCGRWREIHHAGIYIGSGKVIDASSSKGRVIIRKLWSGGEWKIAFAARPYDEPQSAKDDEAAAE